MLHPALGYIISALTGALLTAFGFYVALFGRVKDMEQSHALLRQDFEAEKKRTDERIDGVRQAVKEVLETARDILRQNNLLLARLDAHIERDK